MADASLAFPVPAENLEWEPHERPAQGRFARLEFAIERAIDSGEQLAIDAAAAAISLLDMLDGDLDRELNGDEADGDNEPLTTPRYGVDQSKPPIGKRSRANFPSWLR